LQSGKCKGGGDQGKDREAREKKKQRIRFSGRQKAKRMEMAQESGKKNLWIFLLWDRDLPSDKILLGRDKFRSPTLPTFLHWAYKVYMSYKDFRFSSSSSAWPTSEVKLGSRL
jgi:hypothetical protein